MKKLFFVLSVIASLFFVSCGEEKNAVPVNQGSTEASEDSDGDWFMAQTDRAIVKTVTATSELVEEKFAGSYLYSPSNILDGDLKTTWCEGVNGDGLGESITIEFEEAVSFDEIQVVPGFARTDNEYWINNRIKKLMVTQVANKHFQQKEYTLSDKKGWQSIKFELPQTAQTIELKITDVYAGRKYKDTCFDEFRLLYKGRVIPFKNVETLKAQQKEISLQMLNSGFEEKFKALFGEAGGSNYIKSNAKYLFLKSVDGKSPDMVMVAYVRDGDFSLNLVKNATFSSRTTDSYTKSVEQEVFSRNRNVEEVCFYSEYNMYGESYELGNCKIVKTSYISYVETHTAQVIKLDGDSVHINGVHYKVVPASKIYAYGD